jgi:hypothetical protein
MRHIGLTETQIESIGKETAHHALHTTYNLMWKVRNAAMEGTGRTLAGYLRRAGKVSGVVLDTNHQWSRARSLMQCTDYVWRRP